ncbi:hypothetical protein B0A66_06165 [Flavobacterium hercynium]|uniref:Uncharacterized protein n=1 Tax=Flavobacterium hercynium TaxID=387094 RepID=A0A226HHK2_9FLAO|nr:hypothetical protein B0A66_06165 [Flavobacterium hercynium]
MLGHRSVKTMQMYDRVIDQKKEGCGESDFAGVDYDLLEIRKLDVLAIPKRKGCHLAAFRIFCKN